MSELKERAPCTPFLAGPLKGERSFCAGTRQQSFGLRRKGTCNVAHHDDGRHPERAHRGAHPGGAAGAARLWGGCLSHAHMSGPTRSPSPEDEQAGDEHRLHEAHPPAGLSALTGVREKGLCSCARPPSGSYMIIHVSFLNEIVTDFRSNWFCRFGGEVAG